MQLGEGLISCQLGAAIKFVFMLKERFLYLQDQGQRLEKYCPCPKHYPARGPGMSQGRDLKRLGTDSLTTGNNK